MSLDDASDSEAFSRLHRNRSETYLMKRHFGDPYWLTAHHLDSYDALVPSGIGLIMKKMDIIRLEKVIETDVGQTPVVVEVFFARTRGSRISGPPSVLPRTAREQDLTYSVEVLVDVEIDVTIGKSATRTLSFEEDISIGKIPLMLHSRQCLLRNLDADGMRSLGECPNDRGGYFIIDGSEKTIVAREDPVTNRLYVRKADKTAQDLSHLGFIRSTTHDDAFPKTITFYVKKTRSIDVVVTHLSQTRARGGTSDSGIPVCILFRALGVESDLDILRHVALDINASEEQDVLKFMRTSLVETGRLGIFTQSDARQYLEPMVRERFTLKHILMWDLFPNAGRDFRIKALFLGRAVRQLINTVIGKITPLERDDYTNKRVIASGHLVSDLFRDIMIRVRGYWIRRLEGEWASGSWRSSGDPLQFVTAKNIHTLFEGPYLSDRLRKSLKGNWGADEQSSDEITQSENQSMSSLVQELSRISYLSTLSHLRRINNPVDRSVKMTDPHILRASHWGVTCPSETPDGPNIGLVSHLAGTARLTLGDEESYEAALNALRQEPKIIQLDDQSQRDLSRWHKHVKVLLDDTWIGITKDPKGLMSELTSKRRQGVIRADTSIAWKIFDREIDLHTDRGRVIRPLAVVTQTDRMTPKLPLPFWSEEGRDGIEDLDIEEIRTKLVAMDPQDISSKGSTHRFTHCELTVSRSMLSVLTATIPMVNNNGGARVTLALSQLKSAIGIYSDAFRTRWDTTSYVLNHPQVPMITTRPALDLCSGRLMHGEHVVVAVCTYSGYNMDDAIILNKAAIDRGRLSITCYNTFRFQESNGGDGTTIIFAKPTGNDHDHLSVDGLPIVGSNIRPGQVLLGRVEHNKSDEKQRDKSVKATPKMSGTVDRVTTFPLTRPWMQRTSKEKVAKVRLHETRPPELGDKLASRFSQKGVVGMILPEADMPYCAHSGIVPDVIFNPHGIPTRWTPSHLFEVLWAKAGAAAGISRYDATPFERCDPVTEAGKRLEALGLEKHGHEVMYNGRTGECMTYDIFVGTNYYERLKHMVTDKIQSRTQAGPINAITRQPTKALEGGASGGLRIGEMERDAVFSHGMASFLKESFTTRSDAKKGSETIVNIDGGGKLDVENSGQVVDGGPPQMGRILVPHAFRVMHQELQTMAIDMRIDLGKHGDRMIDGEEQEEDWDGKDSEQLDDESDPSDIDDDQLLPEDHEDEQDGNEHDE